jgi:hypothetical protein
VRVIEIGGETQHLTILQRAGNVRRLNEAEPYLDAVEAVP